MTTFLRVFVYIYGASQFMNALLGVAANAVDGKVGWAIAWSILLVVITIVTLQTRRLLRED